MRWGNPHQEVSQNKFSTCDYHQPGTHKREELMKKRMALLLGTALLSLPAMAQSALSAGTPVYIKLQSTLATFMNKAGDQFWGTVSQPVMQSGKVVIPAGSTVVGHVTKI